MPHSNLDRLEPADRERLGELRVSYNAGVISIEEFLEEVVGISHSSGYRDGYNDGFGECLMEEAEAAENA